MASIQDIYNMQAGLYETPDFSDINYTSQYLNTNSNNGQASIDKRNKLKRAAELKANRLKRTVEDKYDANNDLIDDSNTVIRLKTAANAGLGAADWLLEASENIVDFGQGNLLNKRMTANRDGKVYGMNNKDFIAAGETNIADMKDYLDKQEYDPYSNEVFYNFRKWDGYEEDGKTDKYIYKTGYSSAGGADRYKSQMMQDKYELLDEKRFDGAKDFEKTWNALPEVLKARALDFEAGEKDANGKWQTADRASRVNFGAGWTELSNSNLIGSSEDQSDAELQANLQKSRLYTKANADFRNQGFGDSLLRSPQAFLAGGGKSTYGTVDTLTELGGDLVGRGVGLIDPKTGKLIDKAVDLGTADEITERSNALVGYDNRYTSAIMASVTDKYGKAMKNVELFSPASWLDMDVGSLVDAVKVAFSSPESAAYSLGYMAPALVGAFSKAGAKLFGTALKTYGDDVAKIAADVTTDVAAKELAQKALYKGLSKSDKTKLFLNNHIVDSAGMGALMTNEQLDKYIEDNGGEDATIAKTIGAWMINTAGMKLDTMSAKGALGITKEIKQSLAEQIGAMGKANASKFVAKSTEYLLKATMAGAKEAPQEWLQTLGEVFNEVYGTKKIDIDGKETGETVGLAEALGAETRDKAGVGLIAGVAGGVHMSMGGSAKTIAGDIIGGTAEQISAMRAKNNTENTTQVSAESVVPEHAEVMTRSASVDAWVGTDDARTQIAEEIANGNKDAYVKDVSELLDGMQAHLDSLNAATLDAQGQADKELLATRLGKAILFSNEVLGTGRQILNNRPVDQIDAEINSIPAEDITPETESRRKVLAAERVVAKFLTDPKFEGTVDLQDGRKATALDSLKLKFYGGVTANGKPKMGMLEYANLLTNPNTSNSLREELLIKMDRFISTQEAKFDALNTAKKDWEAAAKVIANSDTTEELKDKETSEIEIVSKYKGGGANAEAIHYNNKTGPFFYESLKAENKALEDIVSIIKGTDALAELEVDTQTTPLIDTKVSNETPTVVDTEFTPKQALAHVKSAIRQIAELDIDSASNPERIAENEAKADVLRESMAASKKIIADAKAEFKLTTIDEGQSDYAEETRDDATGKIPKQPEVKEEVKDQTATIQKQVNALIKAIKSLKVSGNITEEEIEMAEAAVARYDIANEGCK